MKRSYFIFILALTVLGCATHPKKLVVWEIKDIPRSYQVLGPVSVSEEMSEKSEDAVGGLAAYISKDGRISDQVPQDIKNALEAKKNKYKEMIFEKLGNKAKEYGADAIIEAEYTYVPPYLTFSSKASVSAKGTMVKYTS